MVNYIDFLYSSCYFLICLGDSNWGGKQGPYRPKDNCWQMRKRVFFFVETSNCNHQSRHEKNYKYLLTSLPTIIITWKSNAVDFREWHLYDDDERRCFWILFHLQMSAVYVGTTNNKHTVIPTYMKIHFKQQNHYSISHLYITPCLTYCWLVYLWFGIYILVSWFW